MASDVNLILGAVPSYTSTSLPLYVTIGDPAPTFTAPAASGDTAASNLGTDFLWQVWRTPSLRLTDCIVNIDLQTDRLIETAGLAVANLTPYAHVRFRVWSAAVDPLDIYTREAPSSMPQENGFSGGYTAVEDDPDSPDANRMSMSSGTTAFARFGFPDLESAVPLSTLPGVHRFRALVAVDAGASGAATLDALELWEAGSFRKSLLPFVAPVTGKTIAPKPVEPGTSRMFEGIWSAGDLQSPPLSRKPEVRIDLRRSGVSDGVHLEALDCQYTPGWSPPPGLLDTGFLPSWAEHLASAGNAVIPWQFQLADLPLLHNFVDGGAGIEGRFIEIHIYDPTNPDDFVEAGAAPAGPAVMTPQLAYSASWSTEDPSEIYRSAPPGDRDIPEYRIPRRAAQLPLANLSESAAFEEFYTRLNLAGYARPFFLTPIFSGSLRLVDAAMYCRLKRPTQIQTPYGVSWSSALEVVQAR